MHEFSFHILEHMGFTELEYDHPLHPKKSAK